MSCYRRRPGALRGRGRIYHGRVFPAGIEPAGGETSPEIEAKAGPRPRRTGPRAPRKIGANIVPGPEGRNRFGAGVWTMRRCAPYRRPKPRIASVFGGLKVCPPPPRRPLRPSVPAASASGAAGRASRPRRGALPFLLVHRFHQPHIKGDSLAHIGHRHPFVRAVEARHVVRAHADRDEAEHIVRNRKIVA